MAEVLIFLTDGFEEIEAIAPADILRRAGVGVTLVSITGARQVTGSHNIPVICDALYDDVKARAETFGYDALILPGGPGTKNYHEHGELLALLRAYFGKGKLIAAICAAPSVFGRMGLLNGKKATCFPGYEQELAGAEFLTDAVVEDCNIITSRSAGTALNFGLRLAAALAGRDAAEKIRTGIIFNG